jgi:hypothetical protein
LADYPQNDFFNPEDLLYSRIHFILMILLAVIKAIVKNYTTTIYILFISKDGAEKGDFH